MPAREAAAAKTACIADSGLDFGARYATGRFQSNEYPAKMLVPSEKPERGISLPVKQTDPLPNSA